MENKPLEARSGLPTEPKKRPEVIGLWGGGNASGGEAADAGGISTIWRGRRPEATSAQVRLKPRIRPKSGGKNLNINS